jgi:hypothetical protein
MIADRVAAPVIDRLHGREAVTAGAGRDVAYLDVDGFVVVVSGRGGPLLPNGVVVAGRPGRTRLRLDGAAVWDPTLRLGADAERRGEEVLRALAVGDDGPLARAVAERDPELAASAAARLVGLGPGLTPEGDDVVAATAAVVAAGTWPPAAKAAWLAALLPGDLRRRTTALSATLLELALRGQVAEPLHALLGPDWRSGLTALLRLGHSTGRAYAHAVAVALTRLPAR